MEKSFDAVYYEPAALDYELGQLLRQRYADLPWREIQSHNRIPELCAAQNRDFPGLKRHLIVGVRKTHKYVPNHKVSDWLVPYTSLNREQMLEKLLRVDAAAPAPQTFEIGSNSDLVLENTVTGNLAWTIERFGREGRGHLTFPTKFAMVEPLLDLDHRGKTIFRMSVNPPEIIRRVELGTSPLAQRIRALNAVAEAGYPVGLLIAPIILLPEWQKLYGDLIRQLAEELSPQVRQRGFIEIILMTYSFVQKAINSQAFPHALQPFDPLLMTGRGKGKYCYRPEVRAGAEAFLRDNLAWQLKGMPILYIS